MHCDMSMGDSSSNSCFRLKFRKNFLAYNFDEKMNRGTCEVVQQIEDARELRPGNAFGNWCCSLSELIIFVLVLMSGREGCCPEGSANHSNTDANLKTGAAL